MPKTVTATIAFNNTQADKAAASIRARLAEMAATCDSGALAQMVNTLAEAEGERAVWARLENVATRLVNQGQGEIEKETAMSVVYGLLTNGADDTWSGRGNETKRAHFDGVRAAASKVEWLF